MEEKDKIIKRRVLYSIIIVMISNMLKLFSGIFVGFIIPKIMGGNNYGYYKTYTLYLNYIGIFNLGFIDGIYLIYAGKNYNELDKRSFRLYTRFLSIMEFFISLVICLSSLIFINTEYCFLLFFTGLTLLGNNITYHYQFISQVTGRFKELSIRTSLIAILQIIAVGILFVLYKNSVFVELNYKVYIIIYTVIIELMTVWYVITYRDITFGSCNSLKDEKKNILLFFKVGFPLLVANVTANLLLSFDRQFVNILVSLGHYQMSDYGVYAFAYNMLSLITTVIAAISIVLYPSIKNYSEERLKNDYNYLISIIAILTSFCLLLYFPLNLIVTKWLPEYINSLPIFEVVLPSIITSSCVTLIMFNYYKAYKKHFLFFIFSLVILFVSCVANIVAYIITKKIISISIASVFVLFLWYVICDLYLIKNKKIKLSINVIFISVISISYYFIVYNIDNLTVGALIYFVCFIFLTLLLQYKNVKKIFKTLFK